MITPKEFNERKKLFQKTKEEKLQNLIAAPLAKAMLELEQALEEGRTQCYVTVPNAEGIDPNVLEVVMCEKMNEFLRPYDWQVESCHLIARSTWAHSEFIFEINVEEIAPF